MNYEDWKYHPSRLPEDKYEREKAIEELEKQFMAELKENPLLEAFLEPFHTVSRDTFIRLYAQAKSLVITHSRFKMKEAESRELRYKRQTEDAYFAILRKKYFNLEILWRAEHITIPDIRCAMDFNKWEDNLNLCPFLEPVSEQEIEVMQAYLAKDAMLVSRDGDLLDFDLYSDVFRDDDGEWRNMPDWFEFYDMYMGTGYLLELPDIRGPKEDYYIGLHFAAEKAKVAADAVVEHQYVPCTLPFMNHYSEHIYEFSKLTEDEIFQHLLYYEWLEAADREKAEEDSGVSDILDIVYNLESVPDPPPVRAGLSWREAIYYCWQEYLQRIVSEDLPLVWEEHRFYAETGLNSSVKPKERYDIGEMFAKYILHGRELAGEPLDFDF